MINFINQALNILKLTAKTISKCQVCDKQFKTSFGRKPSNFCSSECSKKYAEKKISYHYTCAHCGNAFTNARRSHRERNYCSTKCRVKFNSQNKAMINKEKGRWD